VLAAAEIFDPKTQISTQIGSLVTARTGHTATLLKDGRVLIAGGTNATGTLASAEIFEPLTPTSGFRALPAQMGAARTRQTATLLNNGKVLMAGGDSVGSAEIFDPATESFSVTLLSMAEPRSGHTATLFSNETVLLAGGQTDSMEFFNSADQTFTLDPRKMSSIRTGQEAIALSDTRLLFFGGDTGNTIEEFNLSADTLTLKGSMDAPASTATLLANGKILVLRPDMAGIYAPDAADANPVFTAFDETLIPGTSLLQRRGNTATELPDDKRILVAGGVNAQNQPVLQIAAFNPARIWTDKDDYLPEDLVLLYGSGWKPNEDIYLFAVDSETEQWTYGSTAHADTNGAFAVEPYFIVELRHLGTTFDVSAVGAQSAMQADVTFTDAGQFSYASNPSPASFSNPFGSGASFTESVTAPKNNGTFSATLVMTGTGANPIPASWMTLGNPATQTFVTTGSAGDSKDWTVKIKAPNGTADGTYTGKITASVTSGTGPNTGSGTDVTVTIDTTAPAAPSTPDLNSADDTGTSNSDNITNKTTALGFSGTAENNSTVELFDGVTSLGTTTATNGGNWNFSVNLAEGSHSITAKAKDAAGNTSVASGALSVMVDTTKPTVTINQAVGQADPAAAGPINFTVVFSEDVDGTFVSADVTLSGTAGATSKTVTGGPITFNVAVATPPNSGTVIASIVAGVATDIAGNTNFVSTSTDNIVTYNPCTAPSVTLNPSNQTVTYGAASVTFSATASGTPAPTAQWQVSTNGGASFSNIGAATSTTLTINNPTVAMSGNQYRAVFTNSCNPATATSSAATLTVTAATATITWSNPANITYGTALSNTQLNATASVPGSFTYTPAAGAVLAFGANQNLHVDFVPTDANNYNNASKDVKIDVNKAHLAVKADDKSKTYDGAVYSPFSATLSGFVNSETEASLRLSGALSGNAGFTGTATTAVNANATPYTITPTLGTLSATNYDFTPFQDGALTINKKDATWTTNSNSKTYGAADPSPLSTGSGSGFLAGDNVTATYSRAAGETVAGGPYHITATLSPTAVLSNYNLTNDGADFTINKRPATWTTNDNSKVYGEVDPNPLTTGNAVAPGPGTGFLAADGVTATYSRETGETVAGGPHHITATLSPAGVLSNYMITNAGASFTINTRPAAWTTNDNSKTYGDPDSNPLTTGSALAPGPGTGFLATDNVTATYSRAGGETVLGGPYHITATLAPAGVLSNYTITNTGASFTINTRLATWTTNDNSKTYGEADPNPLTTGSGDFLAADNVMATYSRVTGENASPATYHITATLAPAGVLSNYSITNVGAEFTINKRPATWTTNDNSKTYGEADPNPLTTGSAVAPGAGTGFLAVDNVTATYSRVTGENASPATYHITATLGPAAALDNYIITNNGAEFTIYKRPATWTTNNNSKVYGEADPNPLTTGSALAPGPGTGFLAADGVTATYSRVTGENASPATYHITATLAPAAALDNYIITNNGAEFTINKRPATWTTNDNSKTYGDPDPNPLTTGSAVAPGSGTGFLGADNVTATYSRAAGETVLGGPYHISATLAPTEVLSNYTITNAGASFTINTRPATWTTNANSKTYGEADPSQLTTGSGSNFVAADDVTATYNRAAGETVLGGPYHITATFAPASVLSNYSITNAGASFTINTRPATWTTNANSKTYGAQDPNPLTTGSAVAPASGTGFLVADDVTATYSRAAGENASPPTYHITATLAPAGVLSNYSITNAGAEFTINKAHLTVTAGDKTKIYDMAVYSPFTATLSGFVNGETDSGLRGLGALSGAASFTGAATTAVNPGTYTTITPTVGTLSATNYDFTPFVNGTLTITYGTCSGSVPGGVILPPINSDGTSVYSRKGGSTIPVKFRECDAFGNPISNLAAVFGPNGGATITMLSAVRGTVDTVNEAGVNTIPDAGFRYSDGQWIFNMATSNLTAGTTYTFKINLAYGPASIVFKIGVK
jgi:hypothetical protein